MELPREEGIDVISLPQVTNIMSVSATLTINLAEDEPAIPEASHIDLPIKAQPVASFSVPSQPNYDFSAPSPS